MLNRLRQLKSLQPIDRTAFAFMIVLGILTALLLLGGGHTAPRVRDFSWQERQVGAEDRAFLLRFSRPMNHASVENNLRIEPSLKGKVSWAGRRMAYTLETPAPYGTEFTVRLQGARDRFSEADDVRAQMQPFEGRFRSRDRAFVYLGVEGDEVGRLVLYTLAQQKKQVLTPPNLIVMDFEPYPEGDRILFSANDRPSQEQGLLNHKLYTVTTGIHVQAPASSPTEVSTANSAPVSSPQPAGVIEEILDSKDYQNLKFDLSNNGQLVVVQRVHRQNPVDAGLWVLRPGAPPTRLETEPGGDFMIAPDSQAIAMAQGQGMAILPLDSGADPLDFLPQFGLTLSFAKDGSAAAMVKFNADPVNPTRSLFLVTNQGEEKELLTTNGSILTAQFDPTKRFLYVLVTTLIPGDAYVEQPYLSAINVETAERTDLLKLPIQRDIQVSLAPDGLGALFDQVVDQPPDQAGGLVQSSEGKAIATSRLWFLPLVIDDNNNPVRNQPQTLPLPGLRPRWLP